MTAGWYRRVLLLLGVAVLLLGGAFAVPLNSEEELVITGADMGGRSIVELTKGGSYRRKIIVSDQSIKGIMLFVPDREGVRSELEVRIWFGNQLLTKAKQYRQSNHGELNGLVFSFRPISLPDRTQLEIEVIHVRGKPVALEVAADSGALSMSLLHPALMNPGTRQGVLVGIVALVGVALISILPSKRWLAAMLLLVIVIPLALTGFVFSTGVMGVSDWDYFMSVHESYRRSLLIYHDFPLWNPFTCGGTAGLADPEFSMLSPLYLLELYGGVSLGLRLAVLVSMTTGGAGVLLLGRRLGLTQYAALLAALGWSLGSVTILHLVEGHIGWLGTMWVPWVLWAWAGAYWRKVRSKLACGAFLALIFYQGGIHILLYLVPALIVTGLLVSNRKLGLKVTWQAGWWALGLSAVKLVPALLWVRQFPDRVYAVSASTWPYWHEVFLGRQKHGAVVLPGQGGGWHEYGAYVGPIILALALLALARWRDSRVVRGLAIGSGLALIVSSLGVYLAPALDSLPWLPRSYTSRVIIFTVLGISLLAGFGLDVIKKWSRGGRTEWLRLLLVGLVAVDLASLAYPLSESAFVLPEVFDKLPAASAPIAFSREKHAVRVGDREYDRAYAASNQGYGTLSYCSALGPEAAVVTVDEDGSDYVLLIEGSGDVKLQSWSPSRVVVMVNAESDDLVVINTNYAQGWSVNGRPAVDVKGRVGAKVPAGQRKLIFTYRAPGFIFGLLVTAMTAAIAVMMVVIRPGMDPGE
ncbi:MAG: hypothetical protein ABIH36_02585 [bacterium]